MKSFKKHIPIGLAVAMSFGLMANDANAVVGGECMYTFSNDQHAELADKNQITVADDVHGETRTLDFQDKTLSTTQPGDIVMSHGEPHVLTQKTQRMNSTHYVFTNTSKLQAHQDTQIISDSD